MDWDCTARDEPLLTRATNPPSKRISCARKEDDAEQDVAYNVGLHVFVLPTRHYNSPNTVLVIRL